MPRLKQGKAVAEAKLGPAKPACTVGAGAGDVVHASVNAVGRALPSPRRCSAVAGTLAVAKLLGVGKAGRRGQR